MKPIIYTFTGKVVNPLDLRGQDLAIQDIAHALANVNRFAGHCSFPISVAQHSVHASLYCQRKGSDTRVELQALLHDAAEAYLGDVTKWLKHTEEMAAFRLAEDLAQSLIFTYYGCDTELDPLVEEADRFLVRYEGFRGLGPVFAIDHPRYPQLTPEEIEFGEELWETCPWSWRRAESEFMTCFSMLESRLAHEGK